MLISKYSKSKSILGVLRQNGENPMTKKMMEEHLRKVMKNQLSVGSGQLAGKKYSPPTPLLKKRGGEENSPPAPLLKKERGETATEPVEVAELRKKANAHYSEMGVIHARILPEPEQGARKKLVEKFKVIQKDWADMVDRIAGFENTGVLPEEPVSKKKVMSAA